MTFILSAAFVPANSLAADTAAADADDTAMAPASNASPALPDAPTPEALRANVLAEQHVARLGAELFGRHLIAVEVAGVLLMVALIGATAIVAHDKLQKRLASVSPERTPSAGGLPL
jgi:hypothetical protein